MKKLLDAYKASATSKNAQAIRNYYRKRPTIVCLFNKADADLIEEAVHRANMGD